MKEHSVDDFRWMTKWNKSFCFRSLKKRKQPDPTQSDPNQVFGSCHIRVGLWFGLVQPLTLSDAPTFTYDDDYTDIWRKKDIGRWPKNPDRFCVRKAIQLYKLSTHTYSPNHKIMRVCGKSWWLLQIVTSLQSMSFYHKYCACTAKEILSWPETEMWFSEYTKLAINVEEAAS